MLSSIMRLLTIAEKEWIQIRRDTRSLVFALFLPSFLVLLFGYALNVDVKNVSIAVFNQSKSSFSRQYIEKFSNTEYLSINYYISTYKEADKLIDNGSIAMAVVIPPDFDSNYKNGTGAEVQLLVDGSDSTSATIASGYVKAITYEFNKMLHNRDLKRMGIISVKEPVIVKKRIWYNPEMQSKNFIIPGLIVQILAIISALITSLTISREWERGTMETLITTPVRSYEVILGKMIPYLFIGLFDVILAMGIGYFIFAVPFKGSFIELCLISTLFLFGTSSLGIFISAATRVQVLSVQFSIVITYLPSFILSDFIFPIKNMPKIIQGITYIVPAKYLIYIMKALSLKGISASLLWMQIAFLAVFSVIVCILSVRKFSLFLPDK